MSARAATPERDSDAMPPPSTPNGRKSMPTPSTPASTATNIVPRTPSGNVAPRTPGTASSPFARTPGGTIMNCSADPQRMTVVKVHTAKCTECDKRNKDTMLRCPGCTFQVCKPCRDRREANGRSLAHGSMLSPGGLRLSSGGSRRVIGGSGGITASASSSGDPGKASDGGGDAKRADAIEGMEDQSPASEAAAKHAAKKRAHAGKYGMAPSPFNQSDSSDSEAEDTYIVGFGSPTSGKRRRPGPAITSSPTATSVRPSRMSTLTSTPAYLAPSSSSPSQSSSPRMPEPGLGRSSLRTPRDITTTMDSGTRTISPTDRVQELLEEHGVNTPSNRYQEHFLSRQIPAPLQPIANIPETVKRMAEGAYRPSPEEALKAKKKTQVHESRVAQLTKDITQANTTSPTTSSNDSNTGSPLTVRAFADILAARHHSPTLSTDENDDLAAAIKNIARKWSLQTWDLLDRPDQRITERGLDLRLDHIEPQHKAELEAEVRRCAKRKMREYAEEREDAMGRRFGGF